MDEQNQEAPTSNTMHEQAVDFGKKAGIRNAEELLEDAGEPPIGFGVAMIDVTQELQRAQKNFPKFNSAHEGLAIIEEEFLELRREVFWGKKSASSDGAHSDNMKKEARQVAAMAIRFMLDVCGEYSEAKHY